MIAAWPPPANCHRCGRALYGDKQRIPRYTTIYPYEREGAGYWVCVPYCGGDTYHGSSFYSSPRPKKSPEYEPALFSKTPNHHWGKNHKQAPEWAKRSRD